MVRPRGLRRRIVANHRSATREPSRAEDIRAWKLGPQRGRRNDRRGWRLVESKTLILPSSAPKREARQFAGLLCCRVPLILNRVEVLCHRPQKGLGGGWGKNIPLQNLFEGVRGSVVGIGIVGILTHRCTIQIDSSEKPLAARI